MAVRALMRTYEVLPCLSWRWLAPRVTASSGIPLMASQDIFRVVIRRPDGRTEVIGRRGIPDINRIHRDMAHIGTVVSIRHERLNPDGSKDTVGVHGAR